MRQSFKVVLMMAMRKQESKNKNKNMAGSKRCLDLFSTLERLDFKLA
jgi:hypothetical protein